MKPICVPCQRFFRPKKTGTYFIEGMPKSGHPEPGTKDADQWQPYKLWVGDSWECKGCGSVIIVGVGVHPISEHYKSDFADMRQTLRAEFQVNDC